VKVTGPSPAAAGFSKALRISVPVFFGYIPLGIAFGLLFSTLGYLWTFAALSGLLVYAGAAQFLSIGLLANHSGLAEIFLAILSLNLRHMFYGFSLYHRFSEQPWIRPYLIFGLTDETYSLLTSNRLDNKAQDEYFCFFVTSLDHLYWITGCAIGALLGHQFHFNLKGLDFTLTALFVVLAIEQASSVRKASPFLMAIVGASITLFICPAQMLAMSMALVFAALLCQSVLVNDHND
jgi:4-azaleucine resistance transporter AzlC